MNSNQRTRINVRDQARQRVRVATRWTAVAGGVLAAAFAVVLTQYDATAQPHPSTTPTTAPSGSTPVNPGQDSGQNSGQTLQPPQQAPLQVPGGSQGIFGSSGGS